MGAGAPRADYSLTSHNWLSDCIAGRGKRSRLKAEALLQKQTITEWAHSPAIPMRACDRGIPPRALALAEEILERLNDPEALNTYMPLWGAGVERLHQLLCWIPFAGQAGWRFGY